MLVVIDIIIIQYEVDNDIIKNMMMMIIIRNAKSANMKNTEVINKLISL